MSVHEYLDISVATCTILGLSAYSQSRQHFAPMLKGENHDDYDERTWRNKLHTGVDDNGKPSIMVPAHGMQQAIAAAAKYSKRKIPGEGKSTWTQKFLSGIAILGDIPLGIHPDKADRVIISANADGVRGSGKRVARRFPQVLNWGANFEVQILDPAITQDVFQEMVVIAGMFIGIGRFRPEKGGTNGRFKLADFTWLDNRSEIE